MILVRNIFHAKYGRGDELVALLKKGRLTAGDRSPFDRILVDASGRFFTVVAETMAESMGAYEQTLQESFKDQRFKEFFAPTIDLVEWGSREFYTIVEG